VFLYKQGRYPEAERSFERARELAPDSYTAWFRLGAVYLQTARMGAAEAAFKRSLELKPNGFSYNNLAAIYYGQERYAESIPMMEKAVEMGPVNLGMLMNLARTYRQVPSQAAKAAPVEQRARALAATMLRVNPRGPGTHAQLALLLAETGDPAGAAREIETALALAPANTTVLFHAVMTYERIGRRDDALRAWHALAKTGTFVEEIERRPELKALRADPRFKGEK
jgi:Flp pilus assembly protein TadD